MDEAALKLFNALGRTFDLVSDEGVVMGSTSVYVIKDGQLRVSFAVICPGVATSVAADGVVFMTLASPVAAEPGQDVVINLMLVSS